MPFLAPAAVPHWLVFGNSNGTQHGALVGHGRSIPHPKPGSGTVGFPSCGEFLCMSTRGVSHLNTPGRWKGNGSGKGRDSGKKKGSPEF